MNPLTLHAARFLAPSCSFFRLAAARLRGALLVLLASGAASALVAQPRPWWSMFGHDVDVISVTDTSSKGRTYRPATPENPVYCAIIDQGEVNFGRPWAGEKVPPPVDARKWLIQAMARQGYLVADEANPPTQILVFGWGMLDGHRENPFQIGPPRYALHFIGGSKVDLMWEQEQYGGFVNPRVLHRGMDRVGIAGKVWDLAAGNLFLGIVRSLSVGGDAELLWETRFACPADGPT